MAMKLLLCSLAVKLWLCGARLTGSVNLINKTERILVDNCCMLLLKETDLGEDGRTSEWDCEFDDGEVVVIKNISPAWASQHGYEMISGRTMFCAPGAWHHDGQLDLPDGGYIQLKPISDNEEEDFGRNRELASVGTKKVLVVRYEGSDIRTTSDAATLQDRIFGTFGDNITPRSQFYQCSNKQLSLVPLDSGKEDAGTNGVITLKFSKKLEGVGEKKIRELATTKLKEIYGTSDGKPPGADYVMFCVPPGSMGDFVAYAFANYYKSFYNDNVCTLLSVVMHELGHSMGLGHSGVDFDEYSDTSGMMGGSSHGHDGPLKCFNGPKLWKLGWYADKHITVDPLKDDWVGNLVGIVDSGASGLPDYKIIAKIPGHNGKDYYVWFNRQYGMNSGTSYGDVVHITERASGQEFETSNVVAWMSAGDTYEISNFNLSGQNVHIRLNWIDKSSSAWYSNISIYSGSLPPGPPPPAPKPTLLPLTPPNPPTPAPADLYINCGSHKEYVDTHGTTWMKDSYYMNAGGTFSTTRDILGTDEPILYQSERWASDLQYNVPCANGKYNVVLHLADIYFGTHGDGKRVFDIFIQGTKVFDDLDIYSKVGGYVAMKMNFTMTVEDGECKIEFVGEEDNPKINALEIHRVENDSNLPATTPPLPTATDTSTTSVPTTTRLMSEPTTSPKTAFPTASQTTTSPTSTQTLVPTTDSPTTIPGDPTARPTTAVPTKFPTEFPTSSPTVFPTSFPTASLTTASPTSISTHEPTTDSPTVILGDPTARPTTAVPTKFPTEFPTSFPTASPTTASPTSTPTLMLTTGSPTVIPGDPTARPSTTAPTQEPTARATAGSTASLTNSPTTTSQKAEPTSENGDNDGIASYVNGSDDVPVSLIFTGVAGLFLLTILIKFFVLARKRKTQVANHHQNQSAKEEEEITFSGEQQSRDDILYSY